jgi:hypothetical protein
LSRHLAGYDGRPFEVIYGVGTSLIGDGHELTDDPSQRQPMSAQAIIDELGRLRRARCHHELRADSPGCAVSTNTSIAPNG